MSAPIHETKRQLREECRRVRAALGDETRARASASVCRHIESLEIFRQTAAVLTYMPMRGEVDLRPLLARHAHKRWVLPRILPQGRMVFHPYDPACLVLHAYGMLEPAADLPVVAAAEIGLALVPGLAYDRHGWRLGYGGGFFDRFLADFNGISLGVAYAALLLDDLPHAAHDVPVQYVVTEDEIIRPIGFRLHQEQV